MPTVRFGMISPFANRALAGTVSGCKRDQPIIIELEFSADYDIERLKVELSEGRRCPAHVSIAESTRGRALRAL